MVYFWSQKHHQIKPQNAWEKTRVSGENPHTHVRRTCKLGINFVCVLFVVNKKIETMLSEVLLYYFWLLIANSAYSLIVYFLECGVLLLLLESILRTRADSQF